MTLKVILKPKKAAMFLAKHPWVHDTAIDHVQGEPEDGQEAELCSDDGRFIARGFYNGRSRIRMRLCEWVKDVPLNSTWLRERIRSAIRLRAEIGYDATGAARLVYSEADGISGLIVDRFGSHLVVQPTSLAMANRLMVVVEALLETAQPETIVLRVDPAICQREGMSLEPRLLWGRSNDDMIFFEEHGLRYGVELLTGQKTGFYLDQRENRLGAARYMKGRNVLDVCCYTGAFGLCAIAQGGARSVEGFDSSEHAVRMAIANAQRNQIASAQYTQGDCFETLDQKVIAGQRYGAVILDPPKFARGRSGVDTALRAYHRLNQLGTQLLEPGGFLVTCSCSGNVTRDDFFAMLMGVSRKTRRDIQVLEMRGAAPDHPTIVSCPETQYLKCFICRVL